MAPIRDLQVGNGLRIISIRSNVIAPPAKLGTGVAQCEENEDRSQSSACIHSSLEEVWNS